MNASHCSWSAWRAFGLAICMFAFAMERRASAQDFDMTDAQFDSWLMNGGGSLPDHTRGQLRSALAMVELTCELTPTQKEKIELAARGDLQRFQEQVDAVRKEVVGKKYDQQEIGNIFQRIQPLQQHLQKGLFGRKSLFAKVLVRTLDAAQLEGWQASQKAQRARRYAANVKLFVLSLQQSIPLTAHQRETLTATLLHKTRPPTTFGQHDAQYVAWQASRVPIDELAESLDAAQRRVLEQSLAHADQWGGWLHQQGFEPEENAPGE